MTTTEKNKRIEEVEKKMEELRKELSEIRETPTTDYSFENWIRSSRKRDIDAFYYQVPNNGFNLFMNNVFDLFCKQLMFSYCYDNNWFMETRRREEFPRTNPGYYIVYNESEKRYEETGNNPYYSNPLTVYFSSHKIAKECADWLNDGGHIDDELTERGRSI